MPEQIRAIAFTQGRNVPSARFRVRQYVDLLRSHGVQLDESAARWSSYPPRRPFFRIAWGAAVLGERLLSATRSWRYDVALIQREMISTMVTAERLTREPRVLDVDDAIWVPGGRRHAQRWAGLADHIICGNNFLAETFSRWNRSVSVLPTGVDTARFVPDAAARQDMLIGWSGSSSGFPYLYRVYPALRTVFERHASARLRVMADRPPDTSGIPADRVEFIRWSPDVEARAIAEMSVGLMPLEDSEWERGKCSYKMLLYAACGVPAVVSPVGMNNEILAQASMGAAARTQDEWVDAILWLLNTPGAAAACAAAGRQLVVERYATNVIGPQLARQIRAMAGV